MITPEDEAVIRRVIAKRCPGVVVNLDADANGGRDTIQFKGPPRTPVAQVVDPAARAGATKTRIEANASATRHPVAARLVAPPRPWWHRSSS